jgi:hypothetical protein
MDRLTSIMVRASLVWLFSGAVLGGLMLVDRAVPGNWQVGAAPTHRHILFVGWFVQFVIGVAYWLFPRRRQPSRPLGYREGLAITAVVLLNFGLVLRVIAEPMERAGHASDWTLTILATSAVSQAAAIATFVVELWPRVGPRVPRVPPRPSVAGETAKEDTPTG